jgi:hypothetical protein
MRVGQARKRDANEPAIVQALEAIGCQVTRISGPGAPDLLVRRGAQLWAFEVKTATGTQTAAQRDTSWPVIRSIDAALQAVGIRGNPPNPQGPKSARTPQ